MRRLHNILPMLRICMFLNRHDFKKNKKIDNKTIYRLEYRKKYPK